MPEEFSDIGSIKALLNDARERIKEAENRCSIKINESETRLNDRLEELEHLFSTLNNKMIEWLPMLTNLAKNEENKRNMSLLLLVSFISNIAAWILAIFIYFIKAGVTPK